MSKFLQNNDMASLFTFISQCEDDDADGHTVSKEDIARLAELGCVQNLGFGRHSPTSFGHWLLETEFEQSPSLPLMTAKDFNDKSKSARLLTAAVGDTFHESGMD